MHGGVGEGRNAFCIAKKRPSSCLFVRGGSCIFWDRFLLWLYLSDVRSHLKYRNPWGLLRCSNDDKLARLAL